jgi:hypothetical protein
MEFVFFQASVSATPIAPSAFSAASVSGEVSSSIRRTNWRPTVVIALLMGKLAIVAELAFSMLHEEIADATAWVWHILNRTLFSSPNI